MKHEKIRTRRWLAGTVERSQSQGLRRLVNRDTKMALRKGAARRARSI